MVGYAGKSGGYGAGKMGGSYPLAMSGGQLGQKGYNPSGNAILPYGQGMGNGVLPYSSNSMGKGYDGMNIAVIVQNSMGTYSFFVGADGSACMNVPGGSFMYKPNSALGNGKSLDGLLGSGYNPLREEMDKMHHLKSAKDADYKMRDPNYASHRTPEKKGEYINNAGSQGRLMKQEPKARYNEMSKQAKVGAAGDYGYGRAQLRPENKSQAREPSKLERVAMELPANGYQSLPLGV